MKPYSTPTLSIPKADHVCHAHGCTIPVPAARFCCPRHWYSLRIEMQRAIWREYRAGQEIRKDPSVRYLAVQQQAVAEIALYKPKTAKGLSTWDEKAAQEIAAPYLTSSKRWRQVAIGTGRGDPLEGLVEV